MREPARPAANRLRRHARDGLHRFARSPRGRRLLEGVAAELDEAVREQPAGPSRALYLMAKPLTDGADRGVDPAVTVGYRPGVDDEALVDLLARAYQWHPEERWDADRLRRELESDGCTAEGIRLHFAGEELLACCWTKQFMDHDGLRGLLFVLAVDAAAAGAGLGRRVVQAGLDHLRASGAHHAVLYVDTTNVRAVKLYLDLGFTVVHTEHRFDQQPLVVPG